MKIDIVQLENIRSHTKSTVPFTRGFNCIVGGVGCGKSSVLYAIDFALFGDTIGRKSFEYLMREGSDFCRVTLQFSQNGRIYKLIRGLKRKGKALNQDSEQLKLYENEKLVASMKNDAVTEQIKTITGLDRDLYREISWFRQEHLKELLDAKPRDRQTRLDELFGLSDYETAWSNIAHYQRDYETEKNVYEKDSDVCGLEKLNAEYNRASEDFTSLVMALEQSTQRLANAKRALDETDLRLKRSEEKKLAIEELKRNEARLSANLTNMAKTSTSLTERLEGKKTILDNLIQRQNSLNSQINLCQSLLEQAGVPSNQPLDQLQACLSVFDDKLSQLRAKQEATSQSLLQDQKRVTTLNEASHDSKCPVCSQPLMGTYKTDLLQNINQQNTEREKTLNHLRTEVAYLQKNKTAASQAYSDLQTCLTRKTDLEARIIEEETNLKNIIAELETQQHLQAAQHTELQTCHAEIAQFDLSELQAAKDQKDQTLKQYYAVELDLRTKTNRKADLNLHLKDIQDRIDLAQQKLYRIEKISQIIELLSAIRDAYRSIQPKLRSEFVKVLHNFVQQVLDSLVGGETPMLNIAIDETYTPYVKSEAGINREVNNLSGGERTLLAFAYRMGLGQLIMQSRTGYGLSMLVLDEPTENLGSEDGSIERLAKAISKFKAIEQIIAVTHSEAFAATADHVIVLEKEANISKLSIER
ncbi:MAG: SMC family ATPase [Nitrososphaerota archaeon]|jgi:exonuclease SbcC|nr:SMC family ATPase [Nitrososphaerota archaeon]